MRAHEGSRKRAMHVCRCLNTAGRVHHRSEARLLLMYYSPSPRSGRELHYASFFLSLAEPDCNRTRYWCLPATELDRVGISAAWHSPAVGPWIHNRGTHLFCCLKYCCWYRLR